MNPLSFCPVESVPALLRIRHGIQPDKMTMGSSVQWYSADKGKPTRFPIFSYGLQFNEKNCEKVTMGEWKWGYNANGELGVGDNTNKTKATQAIAEVEQSDGSKVDQKIEDAIDIAAGANHTLILRKDGTVWATGYNNKGQLGNGTTKTTNKFCF